ncbi:hypothetical protein AFLA_011933 [Aspergillus flavus NRRL3357]|nr:hypothetical protein AFLA_011933 [Aspergillus flavus NRRL3357]
MRRVSLIVGVSRWHSVDGQDSTQLTHCSVIGTLPNPPALSLVENGLPLLAKRVEIHILRYEWCCHTPFNCRLCDRSVLRCLTSPRPLDLA